MDEKPIVLDNWTRIDGKWELRHGLARYLGPNEGQPSPFGLVLGRARLRNGTITARVTFGENPQESNGRIVVGYSTGSRAYNSIGIGGYKFAYVADEFTEGRGWQALAAAGREEYILPRSQFDLKVSVRGRRVGLAVDGIPVITHNLLRPLGGDQVGLFAWGHDTVDFSDVTAVVSHPQAFVAMQFGEPYDSLYAEVIRPIVEKCGLKAYRVDEVYRPGIILQDIIAGIIESDVVIAEITPPNPNVFYELGYAHASAKPTILLAERGKELPFDIKSYRCIFYDNTIRGKSEVEGTLRRHLLSIQQQA